MQSCSMFEGRSLFGDDEDKSNSAKVTKAQYDELQKKYDDLNKKYQMLAAAEAIKADDEVMEETMDLKQKLSMADQPQTKKVTKNTVDAFKAAKATKGPDIVIRHHEPVDVDRIESEIEMLRTANILIGKNRFDESLKKLKVLGNSKNRQIKIRAKFATGEIFFRQKEYDLAMQIFEEIIMKDAFSGVVLKTLGRLIACSNKLKLKQKEDQYSSMLYDFFES